MNHEKTVLITGASGGLGLEFAKIYAEKKCDLVLVARSAGKLLSLKNQFETEYGIKVYVCAVDLSVPDAALEVFNCTLEQGLTVDVLINNAGFGDAGDFAHCDWQKQYEMVQVNILALMQLTHCYMKGMIERGDGKILNLSSVASFCAGPDMSIYYASKAFVRSFSEAVAEEVKGTGVTVTALCPGPTATGFEKAAGMKSGSAMFRHAVSAAEVALAGVRAMAKGKALSYPGVYPKLLSFGTRIGPRSVTRKFAKIINH